MSELSLNQQCETAMISSFALYQSSLYHMVHYTHCLASESFSDVHFLNNIFAFNAQKNSIETAVKEQLARMRSRGFPCRWLLGDLTPNANIVAESLLRRSCRELVATPAMVLGQPCKQDVRPRGLSIKTVTTEEGMLAWFVAWGTVFTVKPSLVDGCIKIFSAAKCHASDRMRYFVGYKDGKPVACASYMRSGDAVGLYNIATLAEHRGEGIGSYMTSFAIEQALIQAPANLVYLYSSESGRSVYQGLGFEEVGVLRQFMI